MSILRTDLQEISEGDVAQLVMDSQPEGLNLEFKRDIYGNSDAEKREFLKDLSSFANSSGGHLLIGIDEHQGAARAITPIVGDPDVTLQRLEQIARAGLEPRLVGLQIRAIQITAGGFIYLIRVPKSWNPPHRVSYQNTSRFYIRSSAGAHEASVEELRALFANGSAMQDRLESYISDRVQKIADNRGVVPLAVGSEVEGRLVLHILPFAAFSGGTQIDVTAAQNIENLLQPLGPSGNSRINFDGFMVVRAADVPHGYTQIFRNGIVEATKVRVAATHQHVMRIPMGPFIEPIYKRLPEYMRALQALSVPPPFAVSLSVIGVQGSYLGISNNPFEFEEQHPIDRPTLTLPIQVVSDFGTDSFYRAAIAPAIDALFNSVGLASAAGFLARYDNAGR